MKIGYILFILHETSLSGTGTVLLHYVKGWSFKIGTIGNGH